MIPVYGSVITILLCTFLPPVLDFWLGNDEEWTWGRVLAAYALMTGIVLVLPVFVGGSLYLDWLFVVLAVVVAVFIAPVSLFGTSLVLLLSNVILPTVILWNMASYNKAGEPMSMLVGNTEWPFFLVPIALGLATWFVATKLLRKPRNF